MTTFSGLPLSEESAALCVQLTGEVDNDSASVVQPLLLSILRHLTSPLLPLHFRRGFLNGLLQEGVLLRGQCSDSEMYDFIRNIQSCDMSSTTLEYATDGTHSVRQRRRRQ